MALRSVVNSNILLNVLEEMNGKSTSSLVFLGKATDETLHALNICKRIKHLLKSKLADKRTFDENILNINFNLEILWILSSCELIELSKYIEKFCDDSSEAEILGCDLSCLSMVVNKSDTANEMFMFMINNISKLFEDGKMTVKCLLVSTFVENLYSRMLTQDKNILESLPRSHTHFSNLILVEVIELSLIQNGYPVEDAVKDMSCYVPDTAHYKMTKFVLNFIPPTSLATLMYNTLLSTEIINWNNLSSIICCILKSCVENVTVLNTLVNNLLEKSLNERSERFLLSTLILGKILCLEDAGLSMSYLHWFTITFSFESNRPLCTDERAQFYLACLTKTVDVEPACYLQVYNHKAPFVPATCQKDLAEYLQLVKCHLLSMNESIELGFFDNIKCVSSVDNDIEHLIKQIKTSGKLSQTFLATIPFRRQYFEKTFIPKLLNGSCANNNDRHILIEMLADLGKIPSQALLSHLAKCSAKK